MLTHYSGKEARRWLSGPNMNLWNEQLNWAVWCSTAGCGVSSRITTTTTTNFLFSTMIQY